MEDKREATTKTEADGVADRANRSPWWVLDHEKFRFSGLDCLYEIESGRHFESSLPVAKKLRDRHAVRNSYLIKLSPISSAAWPVAAAHVL